MDKFDTASQKRIDQEGNLADDPTILYGSAGVLYGLHKYGLMLNYEMERQHGKEDY
jgi:hypothetical protein